MMLEPADVGRDGGRPCLDPSVIGIHRGIGVLGFPSRIIEIQTDIRVERALIALQGQRVIATLIDDLLGDGALTV